MMQLAQTHGKHEAHDLVYAASMASRKEGKPFFEVLATPELRPILFEDGSEQLTLKTQNQFGICAEIARDFGNRATQLSSSHRRTGAAAQSAG